MRSRFYWLILTVAAFGLTTACTLPLSLIKERKTSSNGKTTSGRRGGSTVDASAPRELVVDKDTHYVNVMGKDMPELPDFDDLSPRAGKVRGYVKDLQGNPLKGARLGVRSTAMGGFYSGAQAATDDEGYYEIEVPSGVAHFYNAGYALEWGDGLAALGLHPADGKLDSFASNVGGVENFVLLPYGVTSRENVQQSGHLASTYYGGSVYIHYYATEADNNYPMEGSLVEGSTIVVTLTPEGEAFPGVKAPPVTVRKTIGFRGGFYINNIPLANYRISIRTEDGEPLKLELNKPRNTEFGLKPAETTGEALLIFAPGDARADMATPQYGGWSAVELNITKQ